MSLFESVVNVLVELDPPQVGKLARWFTARLRVANAVGSLGVLFTECPVWPASSL